jgi:predicted NBD/HSP70 family sugar kinase
MSWKDAKAPMNNFPFQLNNEGITSTEAIRNFNRAQVLEVVRNAIPVSFNELVTEINLSRTTVSSIVNEMLEIGLLEKSGVAASTGGRPPLLLSYNPKAFYVIGVTILDNEIISVLTDLEGTPLRYVNRPWSFNLGGEFISLLTNTIDEVSQDTSRERILGLGIGVPGVVDIETGAITEHADPGKYSFEPIYIRREIEAHYQLNTIIANRSRAAALGELQVGIAKGIKDLIYLSISNGVVAGLVINGQIYFGNTNCAGEIGHNQVEPGGAICLCGSRGCMELYVNINSIIGRAVSKSREFPDSQLRLIALNQGLDQITIEAILDCARTGDRAALEALEQTGEYIARGLADATNLLNPEMVIIGGYVGCLAGDLLVKSVRRELDRRVVYPALKQLKVVAGTLGNEIAAIGAAALVLKSTSVGRIFMTGKTI